MKLIFSKDDASNITIKLNIDGVTVDFSYQKLIEQLFLNDELEESEYAPTIDVSDKEKINRMVDEIVLITQTSLEDGLQLNTETN